MDKKTILISLPVEELEALIIDSVNSCLRHHEKRETAVSPESPEILNIDQACILLNLAKPTVYSLVSTRQLSHYKRGKKLYFKKAELTDWISSGKRSSAKELARKAKSH